MDSTDRIRAVRIEARESYRDTLPVSTFVPWAALVPVIKLVLDARTISVMLACHLPWFRLPLWRQPIPAISD
jgi:hypothetical protein